MIPRGGQGSPPPESQVPTERAHVKPRHIRRVDPNYLALVTAFALFFPLFYAQLRSTGVAVINGGLIVLMSAILLRFPFGKLPNVPLRRPGQPALFALLAVPVYYAFALLFGMSVLSPEVIFRDSFELLRPALHFTTICFFWSMIGEQKDVLKLERILVGAFVGFLLFATWQIIGVGDEGLRLYMKGEILEAARIQLAAPLIHPYDLAFVTSLFSFILFAQVLRRITYGNSALFLLSILLIVLTQSRSIIIAYVFGLALIFPALLILGSKREARGLAIPLRILRWLGFGFIFVALGVVLVIRFSEELHYLIAGLGTLLSGTGSQMYSYQARTEQLDVAVKILMGGSGFFQALFGNGPMKAEMEMVESAYAFYLFRIGAVGTLVVFVGPLVFAVSSLLRTPGVLSLDREESPLLLGMLVWFLTVPIAVTGNPFPEIVRVSFVYWGLVAVAVKARILLLNRRASPGPRPSATVTMP